MRYDIIFYISKRTSYCEKKLKKELAKIDLEINRVLSCTTPKELGESVCSSLNLNNMAVIIGGLSENGESNTSVILSHVLSSSNLSLKNVRKINSAGKTGYVISYKKQMILALPDDQNVIEEMMSDKFLGYISSKLS